MNSVILICLAECIFGTAAFQRQDLHAFDMQFALDSSVTAVMRLFLHGEQDAENKATCACESSIGML